MRFTAISWVILVTVFLVLLTALSQMPVQPGIIFYLMAIGQFLVVVMVYKVLTDKYQTSKTFDDWYEDHPTDREE